MSAEYFLEITQDDLDACFQKHKNVVTSDDYITYKGVSGVDGFIINSAIIIGKGKTFKGPSENNKMRIIVKNGYIINSGNIECWNIELSHES